MRKSKIIIICILILALLAGAVYAYMIKSTEYTGKRFIPGKVTCEVHEETDTGTTTANKKTSIKVKNTGNVDAYVRVKLVSNWVAADDGNLSIEYKESKKPEFALSEGWFAGSNATYYYQYPVNPEEMTAELLASPIVLSQEDGYLQVIEVFAEAIQAKPANAVEESWHVSIDDDGNITSVL